MSGPRQRLPGTRRPRYRCSLPGLTGFTAGRRGEAGADRRRLSLLSRPETIRPSENTDELRQYVADVDGQDRNRLTLLDATGPDKEDHCNQGQYEK